MSKPAAFKTALVTLLVLASIAAFIFHKSFSPDLVLFSNDAPLGALSTDAASMKSAMRGIWNDLNWVGIEAPAALPHTATAAWFLLGDSAVLSSQFHVPIALIALGLS